MGQRAPTSDRYLSHRRGGRGNRTKLTWPDTYYVTYGYDSLNRMTSAKESGSTSLAAYSYDALSRLTSKVNRSVVTSSYGYSGNDNDLTSLGITTTGTGILPSYAMSYTPAHQIASESITGTGYAWAPAAAGADAYAAVNALNQYVSWTPNGSTSKGFAYDANGSMTQAVIAGNTWTLSYDPENKLAGAKLGLGVATNAHYDYDVLGRRNHKSGTGVTETTFLDDGADEIAEYTSASGTPSLVTRYIPGRGVNETIGSVSATGNRRFYATDRHGSVVAVAANNGNVTEGPYTYDEYGKGAPTTGAPYKYVGMRLDAETGFYFDRARYYDPNTGRFFQVDPVGYTADLNLYPYVNNDPLNKVDPKGLWTCAQGSEKQCNVVEASISQAKSSLPKMSKKEQKIVQHVLKVLGGRGEKNHIEVKAGTPERGMSTTSTVDGETTMLVASGLTSIKAVENASGTSAGGWIVHEGSHAVDEREIFHGNPRNQQERFDTERRAFTAQSYVERALSYPDSGPYPLNTNQPQANGWTAATNWAWFEAGGKDVKPW